MNGIMSNPPIYFTLAYIGFDEVRALAKYVPDIQEEFRKAGYTKYAEQKSDRLVIESSDDETRPDISVREEISWAFGHSDSQSNYLLSESGLAFQTTCYLGHIDFFERLLQGFSVLRRIVGIETTTQVSIRYFDAVIPSPGKDRSDYMASKEPSEIRLDSDKFRHRATNSYSVFNTTIDVPDEGTMGCTLMIGTSWFNSRIGLPPDISAEGLKFEERFVHEDPIKHVVVDFQHRLEVEMSFDEALINNVLLQLHGAMKTAFSEIFSDIALKEWQ
ncbi:TIGR04255 family protein [Ruegeria sp. HKCCD7559]|uniref:TIGR04255 family protein n=1 Tax=Ruegeria sp. HKCCD7559 TaxID=2683005 RepID=UPI001490A07B|nr:TIGR04255 family protein [Ruegeria sp. HKCCD7559]NOC47002.1 TIGR04255 family protein [Ruegeria sp. HKCCD7559]